MLKTLTMKTILRWLFKKPNNEENHKCGICRGIVFPSEAGDVHQNCINSLFDDENKPLSADRIAYYNEEINKLNMEIVRLNNSHANRINRLNNKFQQLKNDMQIKDDRINKLMYQMEAFIFLDDWETASHEQIAKDIIGFLHLRAIDINLSHTQIRFSNNDVESTLLITLSSVNQNKDIVVRVNQRKE